MEFNEKMEGIDKILAKLSKSEKPETIQEEEEVEKSEEVDEEEEVSKSETEEAEVETTEEEEEEEVEKSEEADEEVEEEAPEEDSEVEQDDTYMNIDDVVAHVQSALMSKIEEMIDAKVGTVNKSIEGLVDLAERQAEATVQLSEDDKGVSELSKAMADISEKLNRFNRVKKSVGNLKDLDVQERYEEGSDSNDIESLTNLQKSEILSKAIESGDGSVGVFDVMTAEQGGQLSTAAVELIKKSL